MPISSFFEKYGEEKFREIESEVIAKISKENSLVIATGGGSVLRKINVNNLKQNGKLYFIDRSLNLLLTTSSRPLSSNKKDLKKRYEERYPLYNKVSDVRLNGDEPINAIINRIIGGKKL